MPKVHYTHWHVGVLLQAAYISPAVLTSNTCGLFCNVPQMHVDRLRQTSRDIKGYTGFSSFLSFFFRFLIPVKKCSQLLVGYLIVLHRQKGGKHIWYLICSCVWVMKYFVALSVWLFGILHLKMRFPSLWSFAVRETGSVRDVPVAEPWLPLLASRRSCLSPFEKFSARTWEINELSEKPPPERERERVRERECVASVCVCGLWGVGS